MKNENILDRLSKIAFITAIIGVCTIGICPAFAAIGITVPLVMKRKRDCTGCWNLLLIWKFWMIMEKQWKTMWKGISM